MSHQQILDQLKSMTNAERLSVIEAASRLVREELSQAQTPSAQPDMKPQLTVAAQALLPDYLADSELTAFTALDGEELHDTER